MQWGSYHWFAQQIGVDAGAAKLWPFQSSTGWFIGFALIHAENHNNTLQVNQAESPSNQPIKDLVNAQGCIWVAFAGIVTTTGGIFATKSGIQEVDVWDLNLNWGFLSQTLPQNHHGFSQDWRISRIWRFRGTMGHHGVPQVQQGLPLCHPRLPSPRRSFRMSTKPWSSTSSGLMS